MNYLKNSLVTLFMISSLFFSCENDDENITTATDEDTVTETEEPEVIIEEETTDPSIEEEPEVVEEEMETTDSITELTIGSGELQTNSDYATSGNFEITLENDIYTLNLDNTYNVAGGLPDLVIYFSNETDSQENAVLISDEAVHSGMQSLVIPESIDPTDYTYVLIYCRLHNQKVGFGTINF